jgi:hypothetical protein
MEENKPNLNDIVSNFLSNDQIKLLKDFVSYLKQSDFCIVKDKNGEKKIYREDGNGLVLTNGDNIIYSFDTSLYFAHNNQVFEEKYGLKSDDDYQRVYAELVDKYQITKPFKLNNFTRSLIKMFNQYKFLTKKQISALNNMK